MFFISEVQVTLSSKRNEALSIQEGRQKQPLAAQDVAWALGRAMPCVVPEEKLILMGISQPGPPWRPASLLRTLARGSTHSRLGHPELPSLTGRHTVCLALTDCTYPFATLTSLLQPWLSQAFLSSSIEP